MMWLGLFLFLIVLHGPDLIDAEPSPDPVKWGRWKPNSKGFVKSMNALEEMVKRMETSQERFDGYMNLAAAGMLVPDFTLRGWDVVKQPEHVRKKLYDKLHEGLDKARNEGKVDQISGTRPKFVSLGALQSEVVQDLLPMHEEWIGGIKLRPTIAYGLRVYQNGNNLTMHIDHHDTHVISSIVHVDRDVDEPWPIIITGFDGVTVEYDLQPGEMLFYESAKCIHGRPRAMKGRWYSSLFVHYRPVEYDVSAKKVIDAVGHKHGKRSPPSDSVPMLKMVGTGFKHTNCPHGIHDGGHGWCGLSEEWPPAITEGSSLDVAGLEPDIEHEQLLAESDEGEIKLDVTFQNGGMKSVKLYWISASGEKLLSGTMRPGEGLKQSTWSGHEFQAWHESSYLSTHTLTKRDNGRTIVIQHVKQEL